MYSRCTGGKKDGIRRARVFEMNLILKKGRFPSSLNFSNKNTIKKEVKI